MRALAAGSTLQIDSQQLGALPRLEGVLSKDLVVSDEASTFGLAEGTPSVRLSSPTILRPLRLGIGSLVSDQARLVFDTTEKTAVGVIHQGRRYIIQVADGQAMTAGGAQLVVSPLLATSRAVTVKEGSEVRLDPAGKVIVTKGSKLAWEFGNDATYEFVLVRPARLEETSAAITGAAVTLIKPARFLPGNAMKVQISADGFDFRGKALRFCFGVAPRGQAGIYTHSAPGRLVSESTQGAVFEVRVPAELADATFKSLPGQAGEGQGLLSSWAGKEASLRVVGMDADKVVFEAAEPFVISNFSVALVSGLIVIAVLMTVSGLFVRELNPLKLFRRLALHRNCRFSLSNVQVLMWTLLVLYAFCFVWVANGLLLEISPGVLILLGISGGTSVLSRTVEKLSGSPESGRPLETKARLQDLVTGDDGKFDLLRFQMLGFTLFTLIYAFVSVIRSEGLPEISQNLYLLMGISSSTYLGGKLADAMKGADPLDRDKVASAGTDYERTFSAGEIQKLQAALSVPETGQWNDLTRKAVVEYKVTQGIVPADGSVNPLLMAKLASDRA